LDKPCTGLDPDTDPCPFCGAAIYEDCPHDSLDPTLLDASKAVKSDAPATCDPNEGVCEGCQ
jgi:hypothetical protein